ncbi:pentapeptide repeat-containing protein [Silvimonas amylolytica]|uniref:pentapeptide repeat-containing protein n=1 Tax=Silvimonas amylolytica TaxID=449663 RepID=UPI003570CE6C
MPNLSGIELPKRSLRNSDLSGTVLSYANLRDVRFRRANLINQCRAGLKDPSWVNDNATAADREYPWSRSNSS